MVYIFSPLPVGKNELIWSNITAQTLTLGANSLVMAQTIPQNAKCVFFLSPKVAFTKDIYILDMAKVFEIWLFCNNEISENTQNGQKCAQHI